MAQRKPQSILHIVTPAGEALAAKGYLYYADRRGENMNVDLDQIDKGRLGYSIARDEQPLAAIVVPQVPGYWSTRSEDCWDGQTIRCDSLKDEAVPSWWHGLLGEHIDDPERGSGISIGVVDSGFAPMVGLDHVVRIDVDEGPPMVFPSREFWRHGEIVCRIIADRAAPLATAAIAPGATIYFSNASFARATVEDALFRFPADDGSPDDDLDPRLVNKAIEQLAQTCGVDIINLSLGSFELDGQESGLAETIQDARRSGTLVIAAAGNEPREQAAFPASLQECVGVGAYGLVDWGPDDSVSRYFSDLADWLDVLGDREIFYHPDSAWGDGVDILAPGVGIITSRSGKLAFDVTGTSFSAPIASGLLAVALANDAAYLSMPRDEARTRYAEEVLGNLCSKSRFGFSSGHKLVSI